jgi:hypothetical protein
MRASNAPRRRAKFLAPLGLRVEVLSSFQREVSQRQWFFIFHAPVHTYDARQLFWTTLLLFEAGDEVASVFARLPTFYVGVTTLKAEHLATMREARYAFF